MLTLLQWCPHTYFKARCAFESHCPLFASSHHRRACASVLTSKLKAKTLHISRVTLSKQQPLTPGSSYTPPVGPPARPGSTSLGVREANACTQLQSLWTHIYATRFGMHTCKAIPCEQELTQIQVGGGIASTTAMTSILF